MDIKLKEQIMILADNHELTIETGLAIEKICSDIAERLKVENNQDLFNLVTRILFTTALSVIDEQVK